MLIQFAKAFSFCLIAFLLLLFAPLSSATPTHAAASTRFLVLSDIHFDPFIACYQLNTRPCPLIVKLQQAPVSEWASIFEQFDKTVPEYKQDSNYPLLKSSLTAAKAAATAQDAKYVFVLGDFLGHDYRPYFSKYAHDRHTADYRAFVKKTMTFLTLQLAKTFPDKDVYAVIGNNDSYQDDYVSQPHGQFFQDTTALWSGLIKNQNNSAAMQKSFPRGGYYAVDAPGQPNLRFIILNSVLFSYKAKGEGVEAAAQEELNWLHKELSAVKARHQKALILMHIPTGIDVYASLRIHLFTLIELWNPTFTKQFKLELQAFAPQIMGIFAGHLHSDWFQMLTFTGTDAEIPVIGTPSISPIFGNNPGFKVFSYAPDSMHLNDFITYYYPLNDRHVWGVEYDFNQIYQPNCHACPIMNGMNQIQKTGGLAHRYKWYYAVSTNSQPITHQWDPYYWCAIWNGNRTDYLRCIG